MHTVEIDDAVSLRKMSAYDKGIEPPKWWIGQVDAAIRELDWTDAEVIRRAIDADGRGARWTADRIAKLRKGDNVTQRLALAISEVLDIPAPVYLPSSLDDAAALRRWVKSRSSTVVTPEQRERADATKQTLAAAVKQAQDQTSPVPSSDEGSPRDPRTRRAPRGG